MCRRETAWESQYCRNAKRSQFVCVLVWVYFEHERFESGFRDLTLCVKVLRGSGACVLPPQEIPARASSQRHVAFGKETKGCSLFFDSHVRMCFFSAVFSSCSGF